MLKINKSLKTAQREHLKAAKLRGYGLLEVTFAVRTKLKEVGGGCF